jgi:hypothetical protein
LNIRIALPPWLLPLGWCSSGETLDALCKYTNFFFSSMKKKQFLDNRSRIFSYFLVDARLTFIFSVLPQQLASCLSVFYVF